MFMCVLHIVSWNTCVGCLIALGKEKCVQVILYPHVHILPCNLAKAMIQYLPVAAQSVPYAVLLVQPEPPLHFLCLS